MRLEIIVHERSVDKQLSKAPQKDGSSTDYSCGLSVIGSWASRLEQHKQFCETKLGKYILELEKQNL